MKYSQKALNLMAIAAAAAPVASGAGSYTITPPPYVGGDNFLLMANELDQGASPDTFNDVLPGGSGVLPGDRLLKWDNTSQAFLPLSVYSASCGWIPNWTLNPGEGAMLSSSATGPITINGTPGSGATGTFPPAGQTFLYGMKDPQTAYCADITGGLPPLGGTLYQFNTVTQSFFSILYNSYGAGWPPPYAPNGPGPQAAVGEALFFGASDAFLAGLESFNDIINETLPTGLSVTLEAAYPFPLTSPCCGNSMTAILVIANDTPSTTFSGVTVGLNLFGPLQTVPNTGTPGFSQVNSTYTPCTYVSGSGSSLPVTWTIPSLSPCSAAGVIVPLGVVCSVASPAGMSATVTSTSPSQTETVPIQTTILCSNDPNDKTVTPQGCGPQGLINAGTNLTYVVRFQNDGTGPANQVVIHDTIHTNLELGSLQMLGSSHPYSLSVSGRELTWTLANIGLPPASANEPASHGFIKYTIAQNPGLASGAVITNQAAIVFDLNPPVLTAVTTNTITANPVPVASFSVSRSNPLIGDNVNFTYTGGTAGASYAWNFGPGATPSTSTAQNPTGVVYGTPGPNLAQLTVTLDGCPTEPALALINVGNLTAQLSARLVGGNVMVSWADAAYHLQASPSVASGATWTNVPGASPVTASLGTRSLFFRLANP
jgi:uncharacterized repeat protein (TIGR01451 family)